MFDYKLDKEQKELLDGVSDSITVGSLLGYPSCCTDYLNDTEGLPFMPEEHQVKFIGSAFEGHGFIPCPCCIDKSVDEVLSYINENRHPILPPFPFANHAEVEDWFEDDIPTYEVLLENQKYVMTKVVSGMKRIRKVHAETRIKLEIKEL